MVTVLSLAPDWAEVRAGLPELRVGALPARVVVAIAHPDDEVLGAGGLLARLAVQGVDVEVVTATDGEASHPGSPTLSTERLAAVRRDESAAALQALGLLRPPSRLGLPDGAGADLEQPVREALRERGLGPGDWVLCTWGQDGHPDHEAVGRAASSCADTGARVMAMPIWHWAWTAPRPLPRGRRIGLDSREREAKAAAIACHASQIAPLSDHPADAAVLPLDVLAHFAVDHEVVLEQSP